LKHKSKKPKRINSNINFGYAFGVMCLVVSVMFVTLYSRAKEPVPAISVQGAGQTQALKIEVPTRQIFKGERLANVPFTTIDWPATSDLSSFAKSRAQLSDKFANTNISPYMPVPINAVADASSEANVVVEGIPPGYRAVSVKVDVESSVEGWAQTGNFVDVIVLRQSPDPDLGIEAKVIAENVKILSAGSSAEQTHQGSSAVRPPSTVTLLATAEDALKIRTASTLGRLTFSLRGVGDEIPSPAVAMNQKMLLGGSRTLTEKQKDDYKGQARGPDGKLYVLDSDSKWVKDIKEITRAPKEH
jgi:Flp pilus assembly protein CpaB